METVELSVEQVENQITRKLHEISKTPELSACVFECATFFFVVKDGEILEMPNDASESPKGGWFPDIVTGLPSELEDYIRSHQGQLDFDDEFLEDLQENVDDDMSTEDIIALYDDDEDRQDCLRRLAELLADPSCPFHSMQHYLACLPLFGLEPDRLYYEWEGDYIDLWENVADCGEERGSYDDFEPEDWLEVLNDIRSYIVTA